MKKLIFATPVSGFVPSVGLLLHRVVFGGFMLVGHGWGKLQGFAAGGADFPDPLGIGANASMAGAVFAEAICAALIVLGLGTRLATIPLIFTMAVAAFVVHAEGPLFLPGQGAKEPAILYMAGFAFLLFVGPGRFSVDKLIGDRS
jgi:putative oxidoreductase